PLIARVTELAAAGSEGARRLVRVGDAALAHLGADSDGVLRALAGIDETGVWATGIAWLRHVAHRRLGDTVRAELALDAITVRRASPANPQLRLARLRLDWLEGHVADVPDGMRSVTAGYRSHNRYLYVETSLELAAKLAWLGDRDEAEALLEETNPQLADIPGALVRVLWLIARAASAVDAGDEMLARQLLDSEEVAMPGRDDNWYWRDRTAIALSYVLIPEHRSFWDTTARSAVHRPGIVLAAALVAMRAGDDSALRTLEWPEPGVARAHLPARWLGELVGLAALVGNPAPEELADLFSTPPAGADIRVLGPLCIQIGGIEVDHPDLRRGRVRELVQLLVAHRRVRREVVADALWPDLPDPRHNLRVTLSYLHRAMAAGSAPGTANPYVRADRQLISLVESRVRCDLWDLDAHLSRAGEAERSGDPAAALRAYDLALPLWVGPPFEGIAHVDWVRDEQTTWRQRYGVAANRCGELHLAAGATGEAICAADHAIRANPDDERAFGIAARAHLAAGDKAAARRVLDACVTMLGDLGVRPSEPTGALLAELGVR
ncbi:MAG: bacterial transcriptional activator domain-containing protein, partial [Ilumatobacteraceae bacterium]